MPRPVRAALVIVAILLGFGIFGDKSVEPRMGDQLGPDNGETRQEYVERAAATLAAFDAAGPTFALVSFRFPVDATRAADAVASAPRANAVIVGNTAPVAVPEPAGESINRTAVFAAVSRDGIGGVVVHANGEVLRGIAQHPDVAAVEPVPSDAAWGGFAVRPFASATSP